MFFAVLMSFWSKLYIFMYVGTCRKRFNTMVRRFSLIVIFIACCTGAIFLECWKRYSAEITHRWDLTGFDIQEEHPREEYLIRLKHVKKHERNTVTSTTEPYVPFWKMKLPYRMFSMSMVLLLVRRFLEICTLHKVRRKHVLFNATSNFKTYCADKFSGSCSCSSCDLSLGNHIRNQ